MKNQSNEKRGSAMTVGIRVRKQAECFECAWVSKYTFDDDFLNEMVEQHLKACPSAMERGSEVTA